MTKELEESLPVHSIESFGTHDGPGIRLVIFLQGCNLKCLYCQNPDTIEMKGAGTPTTNHSIVERAKKMKGYFGDEGGVTFSGGEPMLYSQQLIPLFKALKAEGIHTNIDTNGIVSSVAAQRLIEEYADLVMFDVKSTTEQGFQQIAGVRGLKQMLKNIALREASQKPYWLRYVLVPGYTDSDESIDFLIDTFSQNRYLEKLEILPYHKLGKYKWESLGMKYQLEDVEENTPDQIEKVRKQLFPHFKEVKVK